MKDIIKKIEKMKIMHIVRKAKFRQERYVHKKMKGKYGYDIIRIVDGIGQNLNICLWIEWGTLLGYVREGGLISYDYDIDFATYRMGDDEYQTLSNSLKNKGFILIRQFKYKGIIVSETYDYKGTLVDIDYCDIDKESVVYFEYDIGEATVIEKNSKWYKYRYMDVMIYHAVPFTMKRVTFGNGISCNIPDNAEEHIAYFYGKNWRTPISDFDWKSLNNYEISEANKDIVGWRKV